MQMERGEIDSRRWPVLGFDPAPAVLQPTSRIAASAAAAHDEDAHRRLVQRRALHHVVEEAQPIGAPVTGP